MKPRPPDAIARFARRLDAAGGTLYFDIAPLIEPQWTGIPMAAAGLAGALLERLGPRTRFFLDLDVIAPDFVAEALRRGHGRFLKRDTEARTAVEGTLPLLHGGGFTIGIFPSVKRLRRVFDLECSLFHDLSTLVVPQFHTRATIEHHIGTIAADIASNDLVAAVSSATAQDLANYFGLKATEIAIAPNGVSWPDWYETEAANLFDKEAVEPYFLVLGTREPRKNVLLVFDLLQRAPELLAGHRFVFAGRMGWLEEQHALPPSLEPAVASGRILFPGFVGEFEKYLLLRGAQATLYPSLFEGFGLPVLESLSAGTPCVASCSSSIPEVGGDVCCYFDPFSAADFLRAIREMMQRRTIEGPALAEACRGRARGFTWENALGRILQRLDRLVEARLP